MKRVENILIEGGDRKSVRVARVGKNERKSGNNLNAADKGIALRPARFYGEASEKLHLLVHCQGSQARQTVSRRCARAMSVCLGFSEYRCVEKPEPTAPLRFPIKTRPICAIKNYACSDGVL
jgi:hypothetical protein